MQMHARDLHRSEIKPHQCQQCLKSFSSNHQLVQHIRVHTGEKPYKCSYCDRRFKQLSHVQQHTRLHTGIYLKKKKLQLANIKYNFEIRDKIIEFAMSIITEKKLPKHSKKIKNGEKVHRLCN